MRDLKCDVGKNKLQVSIKGKNIEEVEQKIKKS